MKKFLFSIFSVLLVFGLFEGVLRVLRFKAPLPPILIRAGEPEQNEEIPLVFDKDLLWFYPPEGTVYGQPINSIGFPEREVSREKAPGTVRVICMGDSCTASGVPPYSTLLHERLVADPPDDRTWEAFHNAVYGYSVVQGLELFRKVTSTLDPDIITLYYGWNDHWLNNYPDSRKIYANRAHPIDRLRNALQHLRLYQLMAKVIPQPAPPEVADQGHRVPPEEFSDTLAQFVKEAKAAGVQPVLLTAPRATELDGSVRHIGHAESKEAAARLHDAYVELVREVANETATPLIDLAVQIASDPERDRNFRRDGIHMDGSGRQHVADLIYNGLKKTAP